MKTAVQQYRIDRTPRVCRELLVFCLFLASILLSACAGSGAVDTDDETLGRKSAESNTSLGLEYMNRGQLEVALGKLKKAVVDDPGYAPGHTVLAVLYERIGELELAGKHYQSAYKADPANGDVNNNYGVYLCKTKNANSATRHFLKALEDPFYRSPAVALTNAGSCALSQNKIAEANDYSRRALQYDPKFPDALVTMARLSFMEKNYLRSRAFMQRYEVSSNHTAGTLLLGFQLESALQDDAAADAYLLALRNSFPDSAQAEQALRSIEQ